MILLYTFSTWNFITNGANVSFTDSISTTTMTVTAEYCMWVKLLRKPVSLLVHISVHLFLVPVVLELIPQVYPKQSAVLRLPANTLFMSPKIWTNNGSTTSAVGIDVISQYIETDF